MLNRFCLIDFMIYILVYIWNIKICFFIILNCLFEIMCKIILIIIYLVIIIGEVLKV